MSGPPTPPAPAVSRREWWLVAGWALVLVVLCLLPIRAGYRAAGEGWRFTGFHAGGPLNDYQSYMAWMRQARDGHLLMRDRFTSEPHGRVVFHPLFWAIGAGARATGLPILVLWHLTQAASLALMAAAIYGFAARFTRSPPTRALALVLATTASGLGWLAPGPPGRSLAERPIDLWMEEATTFRVVGSSFFTLSLGLALLLFALVWMMRYLDGGRLRDAAAAGLVALLLASIHPYEVVTLYAVAGAWTLLAGRRRIPGLLVMGAVSAPYLVYALLAVRLDPVLSRVVWSMEVPSVAAHLVGWGLPLALAAAALATPAVWRENQRVGLLAAWIAVIPLLLAAPGLDFRRKLIWGVQVVFCLLAAMAVRQVLARVTAGLAGRPWLRAAVAGGAAVGVAAVLATGSLRYYALQFTDRGFGRFLPAESVEALAILDRLSGEEDVVVAGPALAGFLPGWSGVTAFWGHWAQTLEVERKMALARALVTPDSGLDRETAGRLLAAHRIRFLVLDADSAAWDPEAGWPVDLERLAAAPFVRPAHRGERVVILEVPVERLPPAAAPPPPPG